MDPEPGYMDPEPGYMAQCPVTWLSARLHGAWPGYMEHGLVSLEHGLVSLEHGLVSLG